MTDITAAFQHKRLENIKTLHEGPWEGRASRPEIDRWLANFDGAVDSEEVERLHALHLLSVFTYFGDRELRVLLRAMYRDLFKYPQVEVVRRENSDSTDATLLDALFKVRLKNTRFLGIGNPAESGTHLLYYFRQENDLPRELFINSHEIFKGRVMTGAPTFEDPAVQRYVFIDDFCGSGAQAKQYSSKIVKAIKDAAAATSLQVKTAYYVLVATEEGIATVRNETEFDSVEAVFELDETHRAFEVESRYYPPNVTEVDRLKARGLAHHYGMGLVPGHPLGYKDGQLLLGFHHNVPDNTLPIVWYSRQGIPWVPIFKRYQKFGA